MDKKADSPQNIDEYIAQFPTEVQEKLKKIRKIVLEAAPEATEKISYQLPTFYLFGNLVHFGAFKNHIGFYPTPSGIASFDEELAPYKRAKGSVNFPLNKPIPYDLIDKIVRFRVMENLENAEGEKSKNK
ncbi:DUF1801 domain-containing protein [Alkalibacter rhizosphaerae]|uniref:DUF1801 domain-containing protein n=1 Tax=Alkalibacter rhizosphaerae TaxID=2815577 RepID=A0A975AJD4_9FIRM|nr:DUF1801 domain-containing protein [Alkalibacter rhizosphaerae]QSX09490.1 DUF1801 domain-containing protein [Alkalibacter rhizosphaerae]